jgi:hypothetical protein
LSTFPKPSKCKHNDMLVKNKRHNHQSLSIPIHNQETRKQEEWRKVVYNPHLYSIASKIIHKENILSSLVVHVVPDVK